MLGITDQEDKRKMMNEMALPIRYMEEKQAGAFWDELEAQTKPLMDLGKQ